MKLKNIVIAGATGFIGRNLLYTLKTNPQYQLIALSRRIDPFMHNSTKDNILWRKCDGFNYDEVMEATSNCDILIYLIHSMLPTASLAQGNFEDFDLIVADNFAKAAAHNKISQIIYMGGLMPDLPTSKLSSHLRSRLEVENVLAQYNNVLTTLRAGLVIGSNGSSYVILEKLIKRLPILLCPLWTQNRMQPIALRNLLEIFQYCLSNLETIKNKTFDIGALESTSYRELLVTAARVFNLKRWFISIPILSTSLSQFWVALVTGTSKELVFPLVKSLEHEMLINENRRLTIPGQKILDAEAALMECKNSIKSNSKELVNNPTTVLSRIKNVTSIQRLNGNQHLSAKELCEYYTQWLNKKFRIFIKIREDELAIYFVLLKHITLLKLQKPAPSTTYDERYAYTIESGFLVSRFEKSGHFEFRKIPSQKCFIMGIYNYNPSLPWFIYRATQALVHLWVMKRFIKWMQKSN
jgi:nucleoside-diphosphate-sugar epimerase